MPQYINPGGATVSQIARHWGLTPPTARKLVKDSSTVPVSIGPERYRWRDIWAIEGARYVSPADEAEFRRPLLTLGDAGGAAGTPRRHASRGPSAWAVLKAAGFYLCPLRSQ